MGASMSMNSRPENLSLAHAQSMDRIYALQRHIYDLTRAYYLLGRDQLLRRLNPSPGAHILEMGCGTGRNLIKAARLYPEAQFHGLDISQEMLRTAGAAIARRGLSSAITVACADATSVDAARLFGEARFEHVFFSYTLSMIPDWQAALRQGFKLVAPGGTLHVVDFGDCGHLPASFRRGLYAWLRQFHVTPRHELEGALHALLAAEGGSLVFTRPFRGYAQLAQLSKLARP
ncbi:MAG: class I SAM-dependent methyltransferase [Alphaproteobacteria bacterium]|nr:class I SAM-dependent methyltransferase [Alphaproteobacteria bacterium]